MAFLSRLRQFVRRRTGRLSSTAPPEWKRARLFELMEQRCLLAADPLQLGAVYIEEDLGSDLHGDTFEVTFLGGAPGTELTRIIIDGDQDEPGRGQGDVFFDISDEGLGADQSFPFTVVSLDTQDPRATVTPSVVDGSPLLTLDFTHFRAGDKLVFSIDVDEIEDLPPGVTDPAILNEGFDPITSGIEFQGSILTASFSAPHFHDVSGEGEFRNRYDHLLEGTGLPLPADDHGGKRDRTDGVVVPLQQRPLAVAISGTVFADHDLNLQQGPGESGIGGVELSLWQEQGSVYVSTGHTTLTDPAGEYSFGFDLDLEPGVFQVREVQPDGWISVGAIAGTVNGQTVGRPWDLNRDGLTEIALPLGGQQSIDNDFAEARLAEISGYVYHDRNNNGLREPGEEGLAGVSVEVTPVSTIAPQSVVQLQTNDQGYYEAAGLMPGQYDIVEVAQPAGYFDGLDAAGTVEGQIRGAAVNPGDRLIDVSLLGGDRGVEFNFGELAPVSLSGRVHLSTPEGDCFSTTVNHPPLSGVQITLLDAQGNALQQTVTGPDGSYRFEGLLPGDYQIVEATPVGLLDGGERAGHVDGTQRGEVNGNDRVSRITLRSGDRGVDYDFCEHLPASLSGYVYHDINNSGTFDPGEAPIADTVVTLRDTARNVIATTQTNELGYYQFTNLSAGEYEIVEQQPVGWLDGLDTAGTIAGTTVGRANNPGDRLDRISVKYGDEGLHYDFGELLPVKIGGFVYHDRNDNGLREPGEEGISGVEVRVMPIDTLHPQNAVTLSTDATGMYMTGMLSPGTYRIVQVEQPSDYFDGKDTAGTVAGETRGSANNPGDAIDDIVLVSGDQGVEFNFGEIGPASIEGLVHLSDPDGNCEGVSSRSRAVPGVEVLLHDAAGNHVETTVTDLQGRYAFRGLRPGTYTVTERTPPGLLDGPDHVGQVDGQTVGTSTVNDTIRQIELSAGAKGVNYDFCEHLPSSLSGFVYHDRDRDGRRDPGEEPIGDAELQLRNAQDEVVATTSTNEFGFYQFGGLPAGTYQIAEIQPPDWVDGLDTVGTIGSAAVGPGGLLGGPNSQGPNSQGPNSQGPNSQGPNSQGPNSQGPNSQGSSPLGAMNDLEVGIVDQANDRIGEITLRFGERGINYNFGENLTGSLSGFVYHDRNNNGQREPGEEPISGTDLQLVDADGMTLQTTATDARGFYEFNGLTEATYEIRESQPSGWLDGIDTPGSIEGQQVGQAGSNDVLRAIALSYAADGIEYNFGELLPASISGRVHSDPDRNCQFDVGEAPIAGVRVDLLGAQGNLIATTTTDAHGLYRFDGLTPGKYTVHEHQPGDYFHGSERVGSHGGDATEADRISVSVSSGNQLVHYGFCELPPAALSGFVFQDGPTLLTKSGKVPENVRQVRDGVRTFDDRPIAGVVLELRDGLSGEAIETSEALPGQYDGEMIRTVTDSQGHYEFSGIPGGRSYAVYEVHPEEYVDGIDTPGSTSGIAINPGDNVPQFVISRLSVNPQNDAIVLIPLAVGQESTENNFSEIRVEPEPEVPPPPKRFPPPVSPPPVSMPPLAPTLSLSPPVIARTAPIPIYGGGGVAATWHLSVINGGMPRGIATADAVNVTIWRQATFFDHIHWDEDQMRQTQWFITHSDPSEVDEQEEKVIIFGMHHGIPVTGDFDGDGFDEIGVYYKGEWFLDLNGNGRWDSEDLWAKLGSESDLPVTGDWDGDGKDDIGIFGPEWPRDDQALRAEPGLPDALNQPETDPKNVPPTEEDATSGHRLLRLHADGPRRADVIDHVFRFGELQDVPIAGDFSGDGITSVGVFKDGIWKIDVNGDGHLTHEDLEFTFGEEGDLPIVGDFDGNGVDEIGIYREGLWRIDANHNQEMDAHDRIFQMGGSQDVPVVGDFDGDGTDEPSVFRE